MARSSLRRRPCQNLGFQQSPFPHLLHESDHHTRLYEILVVMIWGEKLVASCYCVVTIVDSVARVFSSPSPCFCFPFVLSSVHHALPSSSLLGKVRTLFHPLNPLSPLPLKDLIQLLISRPPYKVLEGKACQALVPNSNWRDIKNEQSTSVHGI